MPNVIALEGIDSLGKSTQVNSIMDELGYYQVVHFQKPKVLKAYSKDESPLFEYQRECFRNSMKLATSGAKLIFDRWHLGEAIYSQLYRGYDGNYVFDIEEEFTIQKNTKIRLILLTEDFSKSKHFIDDGDSLGPIENRQKEQNMFVNAFNKSNILDKRIISVTGDNGQFRNKIDILHDILKENLNNATSCNNRI